MNWVESNLELIRSEFADLEHLVADGTDWVRIPAFGLSADVWTLNSAEIAFRIPGSAGEAPYGFWTRPKLDLRAGGEISNHTFPATTPWGDDWAQFSFSPSEPWQPKADVRLGANMLRYARGISDRLAEGA